MEYSVPLTEHFENMCPLAQSMALFGATPPYELLKVPSWAYMPQVHSEILTLYQTPELIYRVGSAEKKIP